MDYAWWPQKTKISFASYRLRCAQIIAELRRCGVDCGLYAPNVRPKAIILSKRYDDESLETAFALRKQFGTRIVLDLCDNHFFADNGDMLRWQQRAERLKYAVQSVDLVIASTETLADEIKSACPVLKSIAVIGDVAEGPYSPGFMAKASGLEGELELRNLRRKLASSPDHRRLVWFGSQGTTYAEGGMSDLRKIYPILERLITETPIQLTIISNRLERYKQTTEGWRVKTHYLPWRRATISRALYMHEICLIPVSVNPFTRCKTNNRVATALLHGLAVLADSIPAYEPFSEAIVLDKWEDGLRLFLSDEKERTRRAVYWTETSCGSLDAPALSQSVGGVSSKGLSQSPKDNSSAVITQAEKTAHRTREDR